MLEIWGRRNASNVMPVMWAVGEMNVAHRRHDLGGSFGGVDAPAYLVLNPNGRIPTIRDGGFVLWESNAIVRYLSRRYGTGSLWLEPEQDCALAGQWMEWFKATAYPTYIDLFWAIVRTEPALRDQDAIANLAASLGDKLLILERQLERHPYVAGERLTMADIPCGPMAHRYFNLDIERPELPGMTEWYKRLCEHPAFREHAALPFGRNPAEWYVLEREGLAGGGS